MKKTAIAILATLVLAACSREPAYQVVGSNGEAVQPQQPAQPAQTTSASGGFDVGDALIGGAVGYMLGNGGSDRRQTVVEHHYHTQTVQRPVVTQAPVKSATKPTVTYKPVTPPKAQSYSYKPSASRSISRRK